MGKGKSIRIIIPDGNLQNAIEITMPSWDGIAFRIKREYLQTAKNITELKQCGVYFLYGKEKTSSGMCLQKVYVGQGVLRQNGKGVFWRIKEHDVPTEQYWTDAIAFVDNKKEWGKTETSYLENRFTNLVLDAKRQQKHYEVVNGNNPNPGNVTRAKQWELDDYIEGARIILQILGYDFFTVEKNSISEEQFSIGAKGTSNCKAQVSKDSKQPNDFDSNAKNNFPFKIGKVMSCAFREALATGLLKDQIRFLESKAASRLFKTRGNRVIVSGTKPDRDSNGRNRFAKDPVQFHGKTYWITTQVWENGLGNLLSFLEQNGMPNQKVEEICRKSEYKAQLKCAKKSEHQPSAKSFFDYLKGSMCKRTASNYASSFRLLETQLKRNGIITIAISNDITDQKLDEIKTYISSDKEFQAYNKLHHYSLSAAFGKYLEYLNTSKTTLIMK